MSAKLLPIAIVLLGAGNAFASEFERQFAAHEHGHAQMMVALDGKVLEIELESPAMNLVGFEHQVRNEAQEQQVKAALHRLEQAYEVIELPASALCLLDKVEVDQHLLEGEEQQHHAHSDHGEEKHKDHDDHADHADHADDGHSDITVRYSFRCMKPDELKSVQVNLFKSFPGLEELEVQWVAPSGQGARELTPASNRFRF